jgi:hypothetical protein
MQSFARNAENVIIAIGMKRVIFHINAKKGEEV